MTTRRRQLLQFSALLGAAGAVPRGLAMAGGSASLSEYDNWDATEMARLVARGAVTPTQLLDEAIGRHQKLDPLLNAIVLEHFELAREQIARGVDGPLAGVPYLLKDLGIRMAGTVTTGGSRFFADDMATRDSYLTERLKRAGLVIFGKTHSPELGKSTATETLLWGATRNPWNPDYIPGGSSGGSAAAVAAGIVPAAHASDGGGSIRIPASCCGLFGLKPSRFRVPIGPDNGDGNGMSKHHAVTRSVRDSALLLDISRGPAPGEYGSIRAPQVPYVQAIQRQPGKLRIGLMRAPVFPVPVHEECLAAVNHAAALCESLGHTVEEVTLPINGNAAYAAAGKLLALSSNLAVKAREKALGRSITARDMEPINYARLKQYQQVSGEEVLAARNLQVKTARQIAEFMQNHDLILSPTLPVLPAKVGQLAPTVPMAEFDRIAQSFSLFTLLYNYTGQPAMSVPLYWADNGLPVGVQFAGRYAEEGLLLQLAAQLEQAQPWFDRRPPTPDT